jgi:tetratricopeptide (TPR) repeat protein
VSRERIQEFIVRAQALARGRVWGDAAVHYARAAVAASAMDEEEVARRAWGAAGEAWRRDDDVDQASKALWMALGIPSEDVDAIALDRIRLAGVLGELGNLDGARQLCLQCLDELTDDRPVREMALDSLVGVLLGYPDKEAVRPLVVELLRAEGDSGLAGRFRQGQLLRLDGDLKGAQGEFEAVIVGFGDRAEAAAGVAAARGEMAELALYRGRTEEAVSAYEQGMSLHREAGRRALFFRCVAGRTRGMVEAGMGVMTETLDGGVSFATHRRMPLLEADLRIARGMALAGVDGARASLDFRAAITLAEASGSRLRAGRARYEEALRGALPLASRRQRLVQAALDLAQSAPLLARVHAAIQGMAGDQGSR